MRESKPRKPRSALDAILLAPVFEDRRLQAALNEWARGAVSQLGGWRCLTAFQRAQLHAAKLSLSIVLAEGKVIVDTDNFEDDRVKLATRNLEVHQAMLRKLLRDLNLIAPKRDRRPRGMTVQDIAEEYRERKRSR